MRGLAALCLAGVVTGFAAAGAAAAPGQGSCRPTPSDGGGPDRGTVELRAKIGTGHVLTGVVLSPNCTPIPRAHVSFWQSNANGVYTAAGRGAVLTDRAGRFRFEGPPPKPYEGLPAHIHIRVEAEGFETLYTRYEPMGRTHGNVRLVLTPIPL
jgi:protocatechuate 3,4-dioxygenase beta subunit